MGKLGKTPRPHLQDPRWAGEAHAKLSLLFRVFWLLGRSPEIGNLIGLVGASSSIVIPELCLASVAVHHTHYGRYLTAGIRNITSVHEKYPRRPT